MPLLWWLLMLWPMTALQQADEAAWRTALDRYWAIKDQQFRDPQKSPLPPDHIAGFTGLERFPPDINHRVQARFVPAKGKAFNMPTTGSKRPLYQSVGTLHFRLHGRDLKLTVYKNLELTDPAYAQHHFVPFTDLTNGETTYGGGRYLDLNGPLGDRVELDFNKAYNPYCAYGGRYNCPIVPQENHLAVAVRAGVKAYDH